MSSITFAVLGFALVVTSISAALGFNRPSWLRSYTTAARYSYAIAIHVALYGALFLLIYFVIDRALRWSGTRLPPSTIALFALTVSLTIRALPSLAQRMREWASRAADIPGTGYRFAGALEGSEMEVTDERRIEARTILLHRGINLEKDWLPPVRPVHRQLEKATVLFVQLRKWQDDPAFAGFLLEARNDYSDLRQRFDRLLLRVSRALASMERLGQIRFLASQRGGPTRGEADDEIDDLMRRSVGDTVADLCEDIGIFHRDACRLAARGAMARCYTSSGRAETLAGLGFVNPKCEEPAGYGMVLAQAAVLLYVGCWIFFSLLPSDPGVITDAQKVLLITLIVTANLAIAIVPKMHWGFANAGILHKAPVPFVIGAALCALACAVLINLMGGAAFAGGWKGAWARLAEGAIFLPSALLTAGTMAWLVQDHRWYGVESFRHKRMLDAAVVGCTWFFSTLIARLLLDSEPVAAFLGLRQVPLLQWLTLAVLAVSMVFGGTVGYLVPSSVRRAAARVEFTTNPEERERLVIEVERATRSLEDSGTFPLEALQSRSPQTATA